MTVPEKRVLVAQKLILCYSPEKAADLSKLKLFFFISSYKSTFEVLVRRVPQLSDGEN